MVKKIKYNYIERGKKTIVLLHGWGLDKSSFDGLVHFFCGELSVLAIDFPGFGESDKAEDYYDTYEYAYRIFLLICELGLKDIILVGHSFGGRVAIILSSVFGIEICGLILTSSAGLNRFSLIKEIRIMKYKLMKKLHSIGVIKNDKFLNGGSEDYKKLDVLMKGVFVRIVNQDLSYLLKNISVDTKLVWDKKDKDTPYWICKKLHKNIKTSQTIIFNNGGHFCYIYNIFKFAKICNNYLIIDT